MPACNPDDKLAKPCMRCFVGFPRFCTGLVDAPCFECARGIPHRCYEKPATNAAAVAKMKAEKEAAANKAEELTAKETKEKKAIEEKAADEKVKEKTEEKAAAIDKEKEEKEALKGKTVLRVEEEAIALKKTPLPLYVITAAVVKREAEKEAADVAAKRAEEDEAAAAKRKAKEEAFPATKKAEKEAADAAAAKKKAAEEAVSKKIAEEKAEEEALAATAKAKEDNAAAAAKKEAGEEAAASAAMKGEYDNSGEDSAVEHKQPSATEKKAGGGDEYGNNSGEDSAVEHKQPSATEKKAEGNDEYGNNSGEDSAVEHKQPSATEKKAEDEESDTTDKMKHPAVFQLICQRGLFSAIQGKIIVLIRLDAAVPLKLFHMDEMDPIYSRGRGPDYDDNDGCMDDTLSLAYDLADHLLPAFDKTLIGYKPYNAAIEGDNIRGFVKGFLAGNLKPREKCLSMDLYTHYDQFDPGGTSSYINPTGIGERVEEVLGTVNGAWQLGPVLQFSSRIAVGLVPNN